MNRFSIFEKVAIQSIEHSEEMNLHPFLSPEPPSTLCSSIHTLGLLHPPILKRLTPDRYQLICGRYRLRALERLNFSENFTVALVLNEHSSSRQVLRYVLEDQQLSGTLSPMERAYFFSYCLKHIGIDSTIENFPSILGDKVQDHLIAKSLLLLDLEPELQYDVHAGKINEKLALDLLQLNATDRLALHSLFQELELGGGKQKRLLTLSRDLALQQEKTIASLLLEHDFVAILSHTEMNRPQKAATLLSILQKKLFPQSNSAEEHFKKCVNGMKLPPSCTINHSQAFERDEVAVTLRFETLTEVEKRLAEIKSLTG
ncbi:MAG: ParB N-terminal domain-containing protein [Desulfocapsa sp.]|nr:ParB N-terminal domain-containing protein [Desulfocapsa sp.]